MGRDLGEDFEEEIGEAVRWWMEACLNIVMIYRSWCLQACGKLPTSNNFSLLVE